MAREPAVVPPVRTLAGYAVWPAGVIHLHDKTVVSIADLIGYFEIKRSEAADMFPQLGPVQPNSSLVIRGAKMQERAKLWPFVVGEIALIPERSFIEKQRFSLRVPIPWHSQLGGTIKVVFDEIALRLW